MLELVVGTAAHLEFISKNRSFSSPGPTPPPLTPRPPTKFPSLLGSVAGESTKAGLSTRVADSAPPFNFESIIGWPLNFPVVTKEGILF